ncbi:dihydrodiol dehydrogenase 3 isoform X1 [Anopheles sinensis]|uniref:Dihydrodiol dehydrogenase 3 isoform X1 n=1 Tax=Anopheles sinensis TaxID=74873 RepID=A0A084W2B6_ANOSI|nr:dihydrodiol dehydrogenase 3 isoform X1 [Anopheles sinensis]
MCIRRGPLQKLLSANAFALSRAFRHHSGQHCRLQRVGWAIAIDRRDGTNRKASLIAIPRPASGERALKADKVRTTCAIRMSVLQDLAAVETFDKQALTKAIGISWVLSSLHNQME